MSATTVLTVIAAVGGPAGLVALIMVLPQIRKLQADTTKVETDTELAGVESAATLSAAALAQMSAAVARATSAEAKADALVSRVEALERQNAAYRANAEEHRAWDRDRIEDLVQAGVPRDTIPVPPPLLFVSSDEPKEQHDPRTHR